MEVDHTFASLYVGLARSHSEQARQLRERIESRAARLGPENIELLWALVHSHESAATALLEAIEASED
jgi:chemotaxis methyl-accepting protein methylase